MRIALIILALIALSFVGLIVYTLVERDGSMSTISPKDTIEKIITPTTDIDIETLKYQIKTEQKIDELTKKIEKLTENTTQIDTNIASTSQSSPPVIQSGAEILPISGKFLALVMPAMEFSLIDNNGIFDLHTFDLATKYSTYSDIKYGAVVVVTKIPYDKILKNFKALSSDVYSVNETKGFPFRAFYVNPPKTDTLVRIVVEFESQAILIQIPKTKFPSLKSLLLKSDSKK